MTDVQSVAMAHDLHAVAPAVEVRMSDLLEVQGVASGHGVAPSRSATQSAIAGLIVVWTV
jgi:hypothetical protein